MKIGIVSDIHGNVYALKEVLAEAKLLGVERLIVAGDFVNYYYSPDKVLDLLKDWKLDAVFGNHEEYLFEVKEKPERLEYYQNKYGHGLSEALRKLNQGHWSFLKSLKQTNTFEIDAQKFFICHGSPTSTNQYIYPDVDPKILKEIIKDIDSDTIIITGHTHYCFMTKVDNKIFMNPGSVGQSREHGGIASWAIFDSTDKCISFKKTNYDISPLIAEIKKLDPSHPYLSTILTRSAK